MISGSRAAGEDFEDLTGHLRKVENQRKVTLFQCICCPELQKAMKTNAFSIIVLLRASESNENQCFFNNSAFQSFKITAIPPKNTSNAKIS